MTGRVLNPPWLMWGNSQVIDFDARILGAGEGGVEVQSPGQVARIDYGRPETWRFLLSAKLLNVNSQSELGPTIEVAFDLNIGVGRSQVWLTDFETYGFPSPIKNGQIIWSTSVLGPARYANEDPALNRVEWLTAETIQVAARAKFIDFDPTDHVQIEVTAMFTPNTHVRPEWHTGDFPGGEQDTL